MAGDRPGTAAQASGSSWNGRTSTGPMHAAEPFAAHASAASRSGTAMTQKPPSCSFVSANGPSVVIGIAVGCPHDRRRSRVVQPAAEDPGACGWRARR